MSVDAYLVLFLRISFEILYFCDELFIFMIILNYYWYQIEMKEHFQDNEYLSAIFMILWAWALQKVQCLWNLQ